MNYVIPAEAGIQKNHLYVNHNTMYDKSVMNRKMDSRFRGNDEIALFSMFHTYEITFGRTLGTVLLGF